MPTKEKEFAYITGFSSNVYKTISAAEARISTSGGINRPSHKPTVFARLARWQLMISQLVLMNSNLLLLIW